MENNKIKFGKIFWPSLLAALIVSIVGTLIFMIVASSMIGGLSDRKPYFTKNNTVLHLTLEGGIAEKTDSKFNKSDFSFNDKIGLSDLLFGFKKAAEDDNIKGVFIDISNVECGYASAREIRKAINTFEKSGKFAIAYNSGEVISQKSYYIASAADKNYGFPTSAMEFMGLGAELSFFKNTLEKLEIEMQVIRGRNNDFKSAVEPFFRDNMSDSSRVQIERYLNSIWLDVRKDIAIDRKVDVKSLDNIAENILISRAEDAVKYKLLDGVKYRDEVIEIIKKKVHLKRGDDLELKAFEKYSKKKFSDDQLITSEGDPNIAVILAEGDVSTDGEGLTSKEICKLFQDVRKNSKIKTVVFRINSHGGSALASDEIWREVKLTNKIKKVVVSMGDVAASGGYYIAAPASAIFAEPNTITGSIGVFGMIPYTGKMMSNKLGLTFDRASTNKHSVMTTNRKLTEEEIQLIQVEVDQIYDQFLRRVAEGRGMTVAQVNAIARGRVWTGRDALRIGLVDELGGITEAIAFAAKKVKIKDPKVLYYPERKEGILDEMVERLSEEETQVKLSSSNSTDLPIALLNYYKQLQSLEKNSGIQMRIPYEFVIR